MSAQRLARADLHLHTSASDGVLSPSELVRVAAGKGLRVIAITDHDTLEGIPEAVSVAGDFPDLKVIPGVEINTDSPEGEIHILGYFVRSEDAELREALMRLRDSRTDRARRMCQRLADLGMPIPWEKVLAVAGKGALGRPHIAQAMREMGYIATLKEAFVKYLGFGCPAYVEREKLPSEDAVRLISGAGGMAALAHPLFLADLETWVARLHAAGLAGLEVAYPGFSSDSQDYLERLAIQYGLIPVGGSDYHGLPSLDRADVGGVPVPLSWLERLMAWERPTAPLVR